MTDFMIKIPIDESFFQNEDEKSFFRWEMASRTEKTVLKVFRLIEEIREIRRDL